jgi:antitoxin CcdA
MGYDRAAPKRATNVSLNQDLLQQARAYTSNLSATLETLLGEFVEAEQQRRRNQDEVIDRVVDGFSALHRAHGLLSDEFNGL